MQSIALVIGSIIIATTVPADAQTGRWTTLGSTTLRPDSSQGLVRVRGLPRHRQMRICVERRPVRIETARIEFVRGIQVAQIRRTVGASACTAPETLRRNNMRVVRLSVGRQPRGTRAIVSVQAR